MPSLVPKLELPKSGGAIKGIGEKMTANPATGTANFTVPISVTAARGAPQLSLSYSSAFGNGPFGIGWSLGIPRITRKTDNELPQYNDLQESDTFILSGAEDLVRKLKLNPSNNEWEEVTITIGNELIERYIPRTEGLFARIERVTNTVSGNIFWRSINGENITSIYGDSPESRIIDPNDVSKVFSWLLTKTYDNKGNVTEYHYKKEDNAEVGPQLSEVQRKQNNQAQLYLKKILYGNRTMYQPGTLTTEADFLFKIVFDYGEHDTDQPGVEEDILWPVREDAFSSYRSGFEIRTRRLCKRVLMFHHFPDTPEFNLGADPRLITSTDFAYNENPIATQLNSIVYTAYEKENGAYIKNQMPPLELAYSEAVLDDRIQTIKTDSYKNLPQGLSGNYQFTDLNAEGLNGILFESDDAWYYKRNLGEGQIDSLKLVSEKPNWGNLNRSAQLSNLEANGQLYVSAFGKNGGYAKRDSCGSWSPQRTFDKNLNIDLNGPNLRRLDVNGDGKPELLILEDETIKWYENLGEEGFDSQRRSFTGTDENRGPSKIFQNDLESIYLSDMCGDGLGDIVRIRSGEICYWPNLGHGNFGEKVIMDNAPYFGGIDQFDQKRIKLGDIDGSGTTDILYLGKQKTQYWLNQSGNGFSEPTTINSYPLSNQFTDTKLVDLLGNGTSCLVWSSPLEKDDPFPLKFVNITSSVKPYLLVEVKNNMGSVSRTTYKPSTYFYLKDECEGNPWVTKLPFPVQLVHQTEIEDLITGHRFVNEYAYHHGYYDRAEREFRGFGFVEQWDDEAFKDPDKLNPDQIHDKPRVHTKSWFHTGAWEKEDILASQYETEYWNGTKLGHSEFLDAQQWNPTEVRESKRALRGQLLRQEVFADDDSVLKDNPYTVAESRYQVKQLQPITNKNKHAVYISLPLETLTGHYERNIQDPRLAHEMTIEIDDFGNVLKSATIAYPRLYGSPSDPDHTPEQYELKMIYSEVDVFNQDVETLDWYVKGVPLSSKSYEVTSWPSSFPPFLKREDVAAQIGSVPKKLLSAQVNFYRKNSEANSLTPSLTNYGEVESFVLPYGSYTLIMTDDILQEAYAGRLTQTEWEQHLIDEKYEKKTLQGIAGWWVSGGFTQYDPGNFFISNKAIDSWGNISEIEFDGIDLLPIKVIDPLLNTIDAKYDYRILQPLEITDPNGNRQQVAYDGFGRVIRTAVMGKVSENKGDIIGPNPRLPFDPSDSETSIIEYHHDRFYNTGSPNYVHSYTRETHFHDLLPGQQSRWLEARVYSDGFGRELQSKAKVAPGEAYYIDGGILKTKTADSRWLGSGRTVYDNKGQAVKQYEPFFSTSAEYEHEEELVHWGVSPFMHYDPLGRVIRTDIPDGTYTKVEFSPWMSKSYDANDTTELNGIQSEWYITMFTSSIASEQTAAALSIYHKDSPAMQIMDVLGRPVISVAHNKDQVNGIDEKYSSKIILDTIGNQLQVIDSNGNTASEVVYDLVGRPLKSISNDAGTSYVLMTIDNQPAMSWLPRGHRVRMEYDAYRRPKYLWLKESASSTEVIKEATIYGNEHPSPETANMKGQVWKIHDQGGIAKVEKYDFKGAPLKSIRRIFDDFLEEGNWTGLDNNLISLPTTSESFISSITYDALGRPITSISPDGSITTNLYDIGGALFNIKFKETTSAEKEIVKEINYNEKGQRNFIRYGNGVKTSYTYDSLSYRLTNLRSVNGSTILQDLHYTYDSVGNIIELEDKAQQTVFFKNAVVRPIKKYIYDGLNRLVEATGREHIGQQSSREQLNTPQPENGAIPYNNAQPNNTKALQEYIQRYSYDSVGNIQEWKHIANTNNYSRQYSYQSGNNQLLSTTRGSNNTNYSYDQAGNIIQLSNTINPIEWNFENQPSKMEFAASKIAQYRYDAGGERIRKVIIKGNIKEERIYLGAYELYRKFQNNILQKERKSIHVADDTGRICLIEDLVIDATVPSNSVSVYRYQLSDHLGSSGIELDDNANIISYEEYHSYGTTAYYWKNNSISQKRYRYIGKERDEESGLNYHSARYYVPWIGRWLSTDPAGIVDGPCLYQYSLSNPVILKDGNGMQSSGDEDVQHHIDPKIEKNQDVTENLIDLTKKPTLNFTVFGAEFSKYTSSNLDLLLSDIKEDKVDPVLGKAIYSYYTDADKDKLQIIFSSSLKDTVNQISNYSDLYEIGNIVINSHGNYSNPGVYFGESYFDNDSIELEENISLLKNLGSILSSCSSIFIASCFSGDISTGGDLFLGKISQYTGAVTYGSQGFAQNSTQSYEGKLYQNEKLSLNYPYSYFPRGFDNIGLITKATPSFSGYSTESVQPFTILPSGKFKFRDYYIMIEMVNEGNKYLKEKYKEDLQMLTQPENADLDLKELKLKRKIKLQSETTLFDPKIKLIHSRKSKVSFY